MSRPIVLVTGGRDYRDAEVVGRALSSLRPGLIIEGGATGADTLARQWARRHGVHPMSVGACWEAFGDPAGPRRNAAMVRIAVLLKAGGADVRAVRFPGGSGTADCARQATAAGLDVLDGEMLAEASRNPGVAALTQAFGATVERVEPDR